MDHETLRKTTTLGIDHRLITDELTKFNRHTEHTISQQLLHEELIYS